MPSSKSPRERSRYSASPFRTFNSRRSIRTPDWTRSTVTMVLWYLRVRHATRKDGFIRQPEAHPHAIFLSDYDMLLSEHLVQGVDVWINTPRRPWEACGTS